ncbi:MAG: cob(I)yrinic acid a,c-diamide adenosyltransferase [Muribaculaceae bacterium]|nr:cob(I)yrinic acid a,c-diamide adenosyltransferase [Muribaculaceae bacterium]
MKSRLYTRTGDDGTTSLVGGTRAPKDSLRLDAYGTVDELNSWLGLIAASSILDDNRRTEIQQIQNTLFDIGAALATEPESEWQPQPLPASTIDAIEQAIDTVDGTLPPLRRFILPGGHPDAARTNIARTVARRAERRIIALARTAEIDPAIIRYINRLSDYLFALARLINHNSGTDEIPWKQ